MPNILVVDDEKSITDLIEVYLKNENFQVYKFYNGKDALSCLKNTRIDLAVLDIMLPDMDGFAICRKIREVYTFPILMLTARDSETDQITGFTMGADDYITKPFEMIELLARVETVLRRYHKTEDEIQVLDAMINIPSRTVMQNGQQVELTMKEFDLLLFLVRNKNIALYRETIYENVWENDYMGDSRTVDLHIQRLRKKMNWGKAIKAVYKVGYRLEV